MSGAATTTASSTSPIQPMAAASGSQCNTSSNSRDNNPTPASRAAMEV